MNSGSITINALPHRWRLGICMAFCFIDILTMKYLCTNVLWNILQQDFWQGVPFQITSLILQQGLHHNTLQPKHGICFLIIDYMTPKYDHLCLLFVILMVLSSFPRMIVHSLKAGRIFCLSL